MTSTIFHEQRHTQLIVDKTAGKVECETETMEYSSPRRQKTAEEMVVSNSPASDRNRSLTLLNRECILKNDDEI